MKKFFTFLFPAIILLNSCASVLNTTYQQVYIDTDKDNTLLINGDEPKEYRGKYFIKRDFEIKQLTAEQEGYKTQYKAIGQYKRHWLYYVSWVPFGAFFLIPPLIDYGPKAYNYEKDIDFAEDLMAFPKRDEESKEIHFKKVGMDINAYDYRFRYFNSYYDYMDNKDWRESRSDEDNEDLQLENTIFANSLNEILKNNGYIDTTRRVFKNSYLNNLYLEATIKEYTLNRVNHKSNGFCYTDLLVDFELQNIYGDSIYATEIEASSGDFVYKKDYSRYIEKSIDRSIKDALEVAMIKLFKNESVDSLLHDKSEKNDEDNFEPISIPNAGIFVQNIDEAVKSTVTIKTKDGHGSGFIVSNKGHIITNYHVVNDTTDLKVVLNNKKEFDMEILRVSRIHDLALVKIDTANLIPFKLKADKYLPLAKELFAVGTPFGEDLSQSVSRGIISGIRPLEGDGELIQTDASINGGNSGGAMIDEYGLVYGVVSSKLKGFSIEGVAFGIPAYNVLSKLKLTPSSTIASTPLNTF